MTDKRDKPEAKDENETPVEAVSTVENLGQATDDPEMLKKQLEEAEARAAENLDGWQRSQAEFVNYKNRIHRDQETQRGMMRGDILRRVLPVMDDLERALKARPTEGEGASWAQGVELIYRKLQSILEAEGVQRIPAEGLPFDPTQHEALMQDDSPDHKSGEVIEVLQQGYKIGERVLRPALVRVAR